MPGVRGFERARSSRAGDGETATTGPDDRADGPRENGVRADGLQEELSPGNRVRADGAIPLQMGEDRLADQPTDRGKPRG